VPPDRGPSGHGAPPVGADSPAHRAASAGRLGV